MEENNQRPQSLLKPISEWFDGTSSEVIEHIPAPVPISDIAAGEITDVLKVYEDTGIRVGELDSVKEEMVEYKGMTQQMRASLESYVEDEDESLPDTRTYTADFSRVNYDTTLAWITGRREETQVVQLQHGARFISMALHWLKQFGTIPTKGETLQTLTQAGKKLEEEVAIELRETTIDPSDAQVQLYKFITDLSLNPEDYDTEYIHDWSSAVKKRKVLEQVVTPYIGPTLNGLTIALAEHGEIAGEFNQYQQDVKAMTKQLVMALESVPNGKAEMVDLSTFVGGIQAVDTLTNKFSILLAQEGIGHPIEMGFVTNLINVCGGTDKLLQDNEGTYADGYMKLRDDIVNAFYLDGEPTGTGTTVTESDALIQAMDENNNVMSKLLDAYRLLGAVYNSTVETAVAKNNVLTAYHMFLSSLAV